MHQCDSAFIRKTSRSYLGRGSLSGVDRLVRMKRIGERSSGQRVWIVEHVLDRVEVMAKVAECITTAVHGRDHDHVTASQCCRPHTVEVVFLGHRALAVCHDCRQDSGFLPFRQAESLAKGHRDHTRSLRVWLPLSAAI